MPRTKPYHHGNLKRALIEAGIALLREGGPEALTTRACAAAVGVAPSAVFRHFADRRALATAVATEGFRQLSAEVAAAQEAQPGARFRAIGESYLDFAVKEPNLFRLMFRGELIDVADSELVAASEPLLAVTAARGGAADQDARDRAILAWAIVHGLATLALDSQLDGHIPAEHQARRNTLIRIINLSAPAFEVHPKPAGE